MSTNSPMPLITYAPVVNRHGTVVGAHFRVHAQASIIVIIESEGRRAALVVDELIGQHQVVVKNLETNYQKVEGVSGATILGDGKVALILDVNQFTKS